MNLPALTLAAGAAAYWMGASLQALQTTCQALAWRALSHTADTMKGEA